nr:NADH-quinone oxidoreductase subunit NuoE [uncultured Holophaga sp.]
MTGIDKGHAGEPHVHRGEGCECLASELAKAEVILADMAPVQEGDLIPLLQRLQDAYGYLPKEILAEVSERTCIPLSRMYGVITFYTQFSTTPRGRHTIRCCTGTACHVRGAKGVAEAMLHEIDVEVGGTTTDGRFTFENVACLGTCFLAPVVMVDDEYYGQLTPAKARALVKNYA